MKKKIKLIEKPQFNKAGYQANIKERVGSGRKASGRKAVLLRLSPLVISGLRKEAERDHKTLSDVAEGRLARV
jgi:hypothetical protein